MSGHPNPDALLEEIAPLLPALPGAPQRIRLLQLIERFAENCIKRAAQLGPLVLDPEVEAQARRLKNRVLFVCGAHRSGTTLTNQLLDGHSALAVLPSEGTYYTSLRRRVLEQGVEVLQAEWIQRLIDPNLAPHFKLGRTSERYIELTRAHGAFMRLTHDHEELAPHTALLLAWAYVFRGTLEGIEWLVEKTPGNERYTKQLASRVKEARFVHVLRDPRAIYASQLQLGKRHKFTLNRGNVLEGIRRSLVLSIDNPKTFRERYLVLRYEDLAADPRKALEPVFVHLHIGFEPICTVQTEAGLPAQHNSSFARPEGVFKESSTGPQLPRDELEYLSAWTGRAARRASYVLPPLSCARAAARRAELVLRWALARLASSRTAR